MIGDMSISKTFSMRDRLHSRLDRHRQQLLIEIERLKDVAAQLGVKQVVLFGSMVQGDPGLASDIDLLVVWDTPLDYLTRTVELYRRLAPKAPVDLLVYTTDEMARISKRPFIKQILEEGKIIYET